MKEIWFRRKRYGFGWVPVTWQGWMVVLLYVGIVGSNAVRVDSGSHSVSDTLFGIVPVTLIATLILIGICALMGEPLRQTPVLRTQKKKIVKKKNKKRSVKR